MNEENNSPLSENYYESEQRNIHTDEGSLRIRLDTSDLINEVKVFLQGYYEREVINKDGEYEIKKVITGSEICNEKGRQWIITVLKLQMNQHMSLSNINDQQYYSFLERMRIDLAKHLMVNKINYEIADSDYRGLISTIMRTIEIYLTQPISAGTRNSISQSHRSSEVRSIGSVKEKRGLLGGII